jgi:hypothetical protein
LYGLFVLLKILLSWFITFTMVFLCC